MPQDPEQLPLPVRPRRNRKSPAIRDLVRETSLAPSHFIYPLFIHDPAHDDEIASMPGCRRWGIEGLLSEVESALEFGVRAFVFFPAIAPALKSPGAAEACNPRGLVPRTLRAVRERFPEAVLVTDVALDPYNSEGHDGIVSSDGRIQNDPTVEILCQQALVHAEAGADIVAPSDMMDGRIGAIRARLDGSGFTEVSLLSYTAKYASAFYGPFRGALDSAPRSGDKKTYQMDPANAREALREARLDEAEGADILLVKPAGPSLDIVRSLREATTLPIGAYQVSGEYLMIKSAAAAGWVDENAAILETLLGIRRAGADIIVTYFAKQAAALLKCDV